MDKIKIKDAALEQGMKPEELVARLREAGIPLELPQSAPVSGDGPFRRR